MNQNGRFWRRYFRENFIPEIDIFARRIHHALPSDEEVTETANIAEAASIDRQSYFADEDTDPADLYESAHAEGVEVYSTVVHIRQGLVNLFAVGLFHLFEQQLFLFYRRALQTGKNTRLSIETVQVKLKDYDVDISLLKPWSDISILKQVANCAKHSEGSEKDSCAKLRAIKPEFFRSKLFGVESDWEYTESDQPLAGSGLFIQTAEFDGFASAVNSFWRELGEAIKDI
jgi:hypothetical protein